MEVGVSSVEEQRRLAVRRVLGGVPVAGVAAELGRSERWVRKWVDRYDPNDPDWFKSKSRAAHTVVNRTPVEVEKLVVKIRERLAADEWAQVGASAIAWELAKLGVSDAPSLRTIERILVRHDVARRSRRGRYTPKGTEYPIPPAGSPNAVQQADLVGPRYLQAGSRFYAFNMIDVTRRRIGGEILTARSAEAVCQAIPVIWERLGVPTRLQLDNQQALAGAKGKPGRLVRLCLIHGVTPRFIPFAEPWRNGIIEQFNNTFDKKFYRTERFADVNHVTVRYRQFEEFHNSHHRYSTLGGLTPSQVEQRAGFTPRFPRPGLTIPEDFTGLTGTIEWIRLIRSDHKLHILERVYPMPSDITYEYVTATLVVEDQELAVTHNSHEISRHHFPL